MKLNKLTTYPLIQLKLLLTIIMIFVLNGELFSQCQPYIKIDSNLINANQITATGISLPVWLKEGQTLSANQMVNSISVIEFTVNGTVLEFSQVLSITTGQAVPAGKVWKIESIIKQPSSGNFSSVTYSAAGTYSFEVPACANYICIEAWGGGGGGGGSPTGGTNGGGGGGGGYGQECFDVVPGTIYTVTVGGGGLGKNSSTPGENGGTSSVGALITSTGGNGGGVGPNGTGGTGGTSTAAVGISGGDGRTGSGNCNGIATGGMGGNGGLGGAVTNCGGTRYNGSAPGGGGGGGTYNGSAYQGGNGADGKVIISW